MEHTSQLNINQKYWRISIPRRMRREIKLLILFIIGGLAYYLIEILWRGYSHWTMFLLGGVCFLFAGFQNEYIEWDYPLWKQILRVDIFILIAEFLTGCIVNLWMGLGVWNYSNMPFNLLGQICLPFALLWIPISAFAIIFDDYLRHWIFGEEKPRYKLF